MNTTEVPDFFDTWIFKKISLFAQGKHMKKEDWERVDEHPEFHDFMLKQISDEKIPVHIMNYNGQESVHQWNIYIDNKCDEWDSWIIEFFPSKRKAIKYCKNKNLTLKTIGGTK